jgi:hypothetical protein
VAQTGKTYVTRRWPRSRRAYEEATATADKTYDEAVAPGPQGLP